VFLGKYYLEVQIRKEDIGGLIARKKDMIYAYGLVVGKSEGKILFRVPQE
jgi:hypothetical protein